VRRLTRLHTALPLLAFTPRPEVRSQLHFVLNLWDAALTLSSTHRLQLSLLLRTRATRHRI
jgi:hypothetical protein